MVTKWYTFSQNNSFGRWDGPTYVIIEATSAAHANERAEQEAGVYFEGVSDGRDCGCCGDRWYPAYASDATDCPLIYGEPPKLEDNVEIYPLSYPNDVESHSD